MTKQILDLLPIALPCIPDAKLNQAQRKKIIEMEQKGIAHSRKESFLGGAPETFWFIDKSKLEAWTKRPSTPRPKPQPKPKKGLRPKPTKKRRRTKPKSIVLQLPIKKWEIVAVIISFLIIIFS